MRRIRFSHLFPTCLILLLASFSAVGQKGVSFEIKKPQEYDERVLRSERSDQKKFTLPRRFFQNTGTHFNYVFNANNKLNEVLDRAKQANKDDYSQLLSFYNYSLDATAADSIQLDSIIYKASTGIALHDLRNDWVDNLYILWGASYYLQKKFDSAYLMFQFINYAFAPKEKDGYYLNIGSARDGNNAYSISTKEKRSLPKRLLSEPPSRNEAFIWQIRNFLAQDQYPEAASLIVTLRNDPNFPKRLNNDLHEMQALWFYKQNMWDSAANHLTEALSVAPTLQEKARWEYLAAQLYERAGRYAEAEKMYNRVSGHTTDPILDIYSRLATIRVNRDGGEKTIDKNVAALIRMAKQDKYTDYRDIIYYMAAQMELEGRNIDEAMSLLNKATKFATNGDELRNKVFLQLAELSLAQKKYRDAYRFYDSMRINDRSLKNPEEIRLKKESLGVIAASLDIIERQDSLLRIAGMPEDQRKDFVKKLARQLRKEQGLKEEPTSNPLASTPPEVNTLFPTQGGKGEWYFYNAAAKTRGQADFKSRWGNRPNTDNWRRGNAIQSQIQAGNQPIGNQQAGNQQQAGDKAEISYESLYDKLPLTPEQQQQANDSIDNALFNLGKAYIQSLEDCEAGTASLEQLLNRNPKHPKADEALFNLYYCYSKSGNKDKADAVKKKLAADHANSDYAKTLITGQLPKANQPGVAATRLYESIYDLFIEGKFAQAESEKKKADSIYGKNYWTPQLLYIEAVYYIRQRQDSIAKDILNGLISQFAGNNLVPKATRLLDVLSRRAQIEEELTRLQVTRIPEDSVTRPPAPKYIPRQPLADTTKKVNTITPPPAPKQDSLQQQPPPKTVTPYVHAPAEQHYVAILLNKVDPVFINEAKNAFARYNRETYFNKTFTQDLLEIDADNRLLLVSPFASADEAMTWIDKAKPVTPTEIVPWLKGGKYSFLIMTEANLGRLQLAKDPDAYRVFLNQHYPGKF